MSIRVAITDDHPMIAKGLQAMLSGHDGIEVCGIYSDGDALLHGLKSVPADVLLLDIQLPGRNGDELAPELLQLYPGLKILILTNFESGMYAARMLWIGVHGYLLKSSGEEKLMQAIITVYNGGKFVEPELERKMDESGLRSKQMLAEKIRLTLREKEILQLIVNGLTDKEISRTLYLGTNTARHYRRSLLMKMEAKNTAELISKALKTGLAQ